MLLKFGNAFKEELKKYPQYFNYFNSLDELEYFHFNILLKYGRRDFKYNENILDKNKIDNILFLLLDTKEYGGLSVPVKYHKLIFNGKLIYAESIYFKEV